jgi:general secretion pathway protein J
VRRNAGFTLIEVMVAIAVLAMISLLVWQSSAVTIITKDRFEKEDDLMHEMTLTLNRIADDLSMAFILAPTSDFIGKSPSGEILTKTIFKGDDQGDQDMVTFSSFSNVRYIKDTKQSDQSEISYYLKAQEGNPDLFQLIKRQASPPDSLPEEGGKELMMVEGIISLNMRYYSTGLGEWVAEWDSTSLGNPHKMPKAVEITMVVPYPSDDYEEGETMTFRTIAFLEMAPGPNGF